MSQTSCLEVWFETKLIELTKQGKCKEVLLMVKGISLQDLYTRDGDHLLHIAAQHNNIELIKCLLLKVGCKLTVKDSAGMTPLIIAIIHGNYGVAKYLHIMQLKLLSSDIAQEVYVRGLMTKLKKIDLSSEKIGIVLAKVTNCPLYNVIRLHDPITTETFFKTTSQIGVNVDFNGVIQVVIAKQDSQHMEIILKNASKRMNQKWFRWFWEYIFYKISDLHKSRSGKKFLRNIFNFKVFNEYMLRPLVDVLTSLQTNLLKIFLQYDFHLIIKDPYDRYILVGIFGNPSLNLISLLKDDQIDANGRGFDLKTPLHYAAENGLIDNVKLLLDRGSNPNALDENKNTPLSLALLKNDFEDSVKMLLLAGANPLLIKGVADMTDDHFYFEYSTNANRHAIAQILIYEALGNNIKGSKKLVKNWHNYNFDSFIKNCRQQLKELKMYTILETEMTIFTILSERPKKVARYARKEDVETIFTFIEFNKSTLVPYYYELLKKNAEDIRKLQSYRKRAIEIVCQFIGIPDPHHLVVNKIVDYFNAQDMRKFEEAEISHQELSSVTKKVRLLKLTKGLIPKFS